MFASFSLIPFSASLSTIYAYVTPFRFNSAFKLFAKWGFQFGGAFLLGWEIPAFAGMTGRRGAGMFGVISVPGEDPGPRAVRFVL